MIIQVRCHNLGKPKHLFSGHLRFVFCCCYDSNSTLHPCLSLCRSVGQFFWLSMSWFLTSITLRLASLFLYFSFTTQSVSSGKWCSQELINLMNCELFVYCFHLQNKASKLEKFISDWFSYYYIAVCWLFSTAKQLWKLVLPRLGSFSLLSPKARLHSA